MPPAVLRLYPTYRCFWWFRHQQSQWQGNDGDDNPSEISAKNVYSQFMSEVNISFCRGHVSCWVILHLNLNRSNKVHPEFCLKSNLKTISALTVFAFHLVGNNTWIIFLVEGASEQMVKIFGNFIKNTFAPLLLWIRCFWSNLFLISSGLSLHQPYCMYWL